MFTAIKKIPLAVLLLFLGNKAFTQGAVLPIHVNYSESDKALYNPSFAYEAYRLHGQVDSSALGLVFAVCDTFPDLLSGNFYSKDFLPILRVDSIRIRMNLNKHGLTNDTLFLGIAGSANGIFPNENTFHRDTLVFASSFSEGNSYANSSYFSIPVNVYTPNSFSLTLSFTGAANDTLLLWNGYGYDGICEAQANTNKAQLSHFYPNSFAYRKEFGQILPTYSGYDIFYECDTVAGFDTLSDGRSYIQNWDMDFFLSTTTASIVDTDLENSALLFPNPSTGLFHIRGEVSQIRILSTTGKCVWSGMPQANSISLHLPPGYYIALIETAHGLRTQKMIITEKE